MQAFLKFGDQKLGGELELSESTLAGTFTVKRSLLAAGREPQVGRLVSIPAAGFLGKELRIVKQDRDGENLILWIRYPKEDPLARPGGLAQF
jgi:hypothetical protein